MKKQDIASLVYWGLVIVGYVTFFFLVIRPYFLSGDSPFDKVNGWFPFFFSFVLVIVIGVIVTAILLELLHMLGAKMGGYNITSVNILRFNFYKDDNKIRFRFAKFDGLTGETKIVPNEKKGLDANPTMYIFLNSIFFILEFAGAYFFFFLYKDSNNPVTSFFAYAVLVLGLTTLVIWLYNLLPIQMDSMTDGYRFAISRKEKRKEFNKSLLAANNTLDDLVNENTEGNEEQVVVPTGNNLDAVYAYLMLNDKAKALEVVENLLNDKEMKKLELELMCLKFYIQVIDAPLDEGRTIYDKDFSLEDRRDVSQQNGLVFIDSYVLMAGLFDKSRSECDRVLKKVAKQYKHIANNKKKIERELLNAAIDRVMSAHPNWELDQYKIVEEQE